MYPYYILYHFDRWKINGKGIIFNPKRIFYWFQLIRRRIWRL